MSISLQPQSVEALKTLLTELGKDVFEPNRQLVDDGRYPRANMEVLAQHGITAITIPKEWGGLGLSYDAFATAVQTIARYCGSTAMVYVMHMAAVETVKLVGSRQQKEEFLLPLSQGKIGSLAFSEPGTGGHFWYCSSQAGREGTDYVLSAKKSFVTSAGQADWYIVQTRMPDSERPEDMSYYLVSNDQEGISASGHWDAMGLRGNSSTPMTFERVVVPESRRLGEDGAAKYWNDHAIDPMFLLGASACWLGIAEGAMQRAVEHTKGTVHKDFNRKMSDYQVIRHYIAKMAVSTKVTHAAVHEVAATMDRLSQTSRPLGEDLYSLWVLKVFAAQNVIEVTNLALQVSGGRGYKRGPIEQAFRDGRAGALMGPTNEMCSEWVAKTLLDVPLGYWYEDRDV